MSITVVSTFHKPVLDLYGQRFVDSFSQNIDKNIKLLLYAEDCVPGSNDSRITILDQKTSLPKLLAFKQRWKDVPKANGKCPPEIKARRPRDWHKEFKWDAIRFANKVYAVFDAAERCDTDWIVWMDADSYIHSPWSYEDFIALLPQDKWITYVGRGKGSQTWPECGFYGMNKNSTVCQEFMKEFERMYEDAEFGMFKLEEWHDSYVFGHILNNFKIVQTHYLDYSEDMYLREASTGGGGHPLINGPLGKFMDHMKGGRKDTGKSLQKDLMVNRTEDYWKS